MLAENECKFYSACFLSLYPPAHLYQRATENEDIYISRISYTPVPELRESSSSTAILLTSRDKQELPSSQNLPYHVLRVSFVERFVRALLYVAIACRRTSGKLDLGARV